MPLGEFGYILTSSEGKERNSFQPRILYNIVAYEQIDRKKQKERERERKRQIEKERERERERDRLRRRERKDLVLKKKDIHN